MVNNQEYNYKGRDFVNKISCFPRGLLVTTHLSGQHQFRKDFDKLQEIKSINRRFIRRLEKRCNVHQKRRLERFIVTETTKQRNHCHYILETPIHLSSSQFITNIILSHRETKGFGSIDVRNVRYKSGIIDYLCKELQPDKDSIEWENCYFRDSHNNFQLQKVV